MKSEIRDDNPLWSPIDPREVELTLLAYCFRSSRVTRRILIERDYHEDAFQDTLASRLAVVLKHLCLRKDSFKLPEVLPDLGKELGCECKSLEQVMSASIELFDRFLWLKTLEQRQVKQLFLRGLRHLSHRSDLLYMAEAKESSDDSD